jgi:SAM-dependent methyltransferase
VRALPIRTRARDVVAAGFVGNHLDDPPAALRGFAHAVRPGGTVLASTWARGDEHPVKPAVEAALLRRGWRRPAWYSALKDRTTPLTDAPDSLARAAVAAGLVDVTVEVVTVDVGVDVDALIEWRMWLPPSAPFVSALRPDDRAALADEARAALGAAACDARLQMVALSSRVAA